MSIPESPERERAKAIAREFSERGDATGWFDALYREAAGDNQKIPWADLEPNRYLRAWAEKYGLEGDGRTALVVGCGLGDDAKFLRDHGFRVAAFDISPTAINWAKQLYGEADIEFQVMDLFEPFPHWRSNFDLVVEVYTIQPLPMEMRERTIDAVASFVKEAGELLVVTRGREDDEQPDQLPWPMSRADLARFERNGLVQRSFDIMPGDEETPSPRFVVHYDRPAN